MFQANPAIKCRLLVISELLGGLFLVLELPRLENVSADELSIQPAEDAMGMHSLVAILLLKFMHPDPQILNTLEWLRATPYPFSGTTKYFYPFYVEYESLAKGGSRRFVLDQGKERTKFTDGNYRSCIPSELLATPCIPTSYPSGTWHQGSELIRTRGIAQRHPWGYDQVPHIVGLRVQSKSTP